MKLAAPTTWSTSLRYASAVEHNTAEQFAKTGRTKPRKHLSKSDSPVLKASLQYFLKIPSLRKAALELNEASSQRSSNVTP